MNTLALLLILLSPAYAQQKLGLTECVRYAVENSPRTHVSKLATATARAEQSNAFARFLPSLDASAAHGLSQTDPKGGDDPWSSSLSVTLTESLYDNGESLTQHRIAKLRTESAELDAARLREQVALEVATEYYRYSLAVILKNVREQQAETLKKQLRIAESHYRQGFKTRKDFLRLQSQAQRSEIDVLSSRNAILRSEQELRRLLGAPPEEPIEFAPMTIEANPAPGEMQGKLMTEVAATRSTFGNVLDFRISQLQLRGQEERVSLANRRRWPQVLVTAGASYSNSGYLGSNEPFADSQVYGWNALLTLRYNIWDWGTRSRDVETAQRSLLTQESDLRRVQLDLDAQLRNLSLQLSVNQANEKLNLELLKAEEQSYDLIQAEYREGKVSYLDLITSLNSLLDARVRYYSTRFEALESAARARYYQGTLYETLTAH